MTTASAPAPAASDSRTTPFVLVVEDDASLRALVSQALAEAGISAVEAADPDQALAVCLSASPVWERGQPPGWQPPGAPPTVLSLVLLDWRLGQATGREFTSRYRALPPPHAPIVLVTGAEDVVDNVEEIGARGFLKKPFDLDELVETVTRFVPRRPWSAVGAAHAPAAVRSPSTPAHRSPRQATARREDLERRRLLERMRDEVAAIGRALRAMDTQVLALAEVEAARRLTAEEQRQRRDLRLETEAHQHRLRELRMEFAALTGRPHGAAGGTDVTRSSRRHEH